VLDFQKTDSSNEKRDVWVKKGIIQPSTTVSIGKYSLKNKGIHSFSKEPTRMEKKLQGVVFIASRCFFWQHFNELEQRG